MAVMVRYPAPLRPGDRIGVTAPSAGVDDALWPRLEVAVGWLRRKGFDVEVGDCIQAPTHVSASRDARAAELQRMLTDPTIRCVIPPWGGETAIDLLPLIDFDAVAAAQPTWAVGYSDTSTWLTPLTLLTGTATVHGHNLMDTPYAAEPGLAHWLDVVTAEPGAELVQGSPGRYRTGGHDDWEADPAVCAHTLDGVGGWARIDEGHEDELVVLSGRLIGGCLETLAHLAGTAYGDVGGFARAHAPEGLVHYLDVSSWGAFDVCRALHGMRLAGWFEGTRGILVSRTHAPDAEGFSQHDAVRDALGGLGVPIVAEVECGHVPPHLALVNGAPTTVTMSEDERSVRQTLA